MRLVGQLRSSNNWARVFPGSGRDICRSGQSHSSWLRSSSGLHHPRRPQQPTSLGRFDKPGKVRLLLPRNPGMVGYSSMDQKVSTYLQGSDLRKRNKPRCRRCFGLCRRFHYVCWCTIRFYWFFIICSRLYRRINGGLHNDARERRIDPAILGERFRNTDKRKDRTKAFQSDQIAKTRYEIRYRKPRLFSRLIHGQSNKACTIG
jgi:hypothetical protein